MTSSFSSPGHTDAGSFRIPREGHDIFGHDGDLAFFDATLRVAHPFTDLLGDLGSAAKRWNDLWVAGKVTGRFGSTAGIWVGGGLAGASTSTAQNSGSTETTIASFTILANGFDFNGHAILFDAYGTFAANGNNKQLRVKLDGTTFADFGSVAANSGSWHIHAEVRRSSTTAAKCGATLVTDNATLTDQAKYSSVTVADWTSNRAFIVTGQATSDGDIVKQMHRVTFERIV